MAEATSLTQVPTQFQGALDAQQHDRFDVFVPQMLRAADVCVDGQRKMLRCSNTEQMLQLISDVFFKPYGRAHTIFGAACNTVEIREDCTGADMGLYPQRGVLQLTLQQMAGPATHCLADDEWERALSTQLTEGLPNPHSTAADAPLPTATAALTPAQVHARHFTADGRARSDAEATPLHPRNLANETPPASQAVAPAADAEPGVAEPSAPHSVTVQLRVGGPDSAAEQRDRLLIDALTGLTQRITQPPSLPREPPLELRPNSEGRKLSAPAAVLYKVVLLLKALLHPDPRAATAAFYSIAQAAGEPLDAYLSRVQRLARFTFNVSQHAECQASGEQAVSEAERRRLQERERLLTYSRKNPTASDALCQVADHAHLWHLNRDCRGRRPAGAAAAAAAAHAPALVETAFPAPAGAGPGLVAAPLQAAAAALQSAVGAFHTAAATYTPANPNPPPGPMPPQPAQASLPPWAARPPPQARPLQPARAAPPPPAAAQAPPPPPAGVAPPLQPQAVPPPQPHEEPPWAALQQLHGLVAPLLAAPPAPIEAPIQGVDLGPWLASLQPSTPWPPGRLVPAPVANMTPAEAYVAGYNACDAHAGPLRDICARQHERMQAHNRRLADTGNRWKQLAHDAVNRLWGFARDSLNFPGSAVGAAPQLPGGDPCQQHA
jgi:hypothetical protein